MMVVEFILLALASYLLGSVPAAYLVARWVRGIDLTKHGTGAVGTTNLLTIAPRWTGVPVVIFDIAKGFALLWVGNALGLSLAQQATVGLAAIVGHNWSVFLGFDGGRGVLTTLGIALVLPLINGYWPWELGAVLVITLINVLIAGSTVLGIIIGAAAMPIISASLREPLPLTMVYLAMFVILVLKRVTAPRLISPKSLRRWELLANRLLFDRDVRDRNTWIRRTFSRRDSAGQPSEPQATKEKG